MYILRRIKSDSVKYIIGMAILSLLLVSCEEPEKQQAETLEIVIEETEEDGGTGGNFFFEWGVPKGDDPPFFEAVMISTLGQQGISFTTRAVTVE